LNFRIASQTKPNTQLKRKFVLNLALVLFLNVLVKPFWLFGIDRNIQIAVGNIDYGFYFSLFNFSLLLNIMLDLGLTNFNNRNIAQNSQLLSKHFSNFVSIKFLLALLYLVVTIVVAFFIKYSEEQISFLFFLIFNQFLLSFILYLRSNITALIMFKIDSLISVADRVLLIIFCSLLLWGNIFEGKFQIIWLVYAQTIAYLLTAGMAFIVIFKKLEFFKLKLDFIFLQAIIKKSLPYAVLVLLMTSYSRLDSVMLERLLENGKEQAGIYAQAFRILDAGTALGYLFAGLLLPIFSKMIKQHESVNQMIRLSFLLLVVPVVIFAFGSSFYSYDLMNLLYVNHVGEAAEIYKYLIFSFISISITYIFGTLLTANGNLKALNIMAATGCLLNIILNFILIPLHGALGSAIASLVTQTFTALTQIIISFRKFKFKINLKFLFIMSIFILAYSLICVGANQLPFNWLVNLSITLCGGVILALITKLINIKSIYSIIRYDK